MSSEGGSFGNLGLHVGADWMLRCCTYSDRPPILTIDAGDCAVAVNIANSMSAEQRVAFARELATVAQKYADECARLQAAANADPASTQAA